MFYPTTKPEIAEFLDRLAKANYIQFYELQSRMPGLRWTIYVAPGQPGRVMTTAQARRWIDGVITGISAERALWSDVVEFERREAERTIDPSIPYVDVSID